MLRGHAAKHLTREDQDHLTKVAGVHSLAAFKSTRKHHHLFDAKSGLTSCHDCENVERKLREAGVLDSNLDRAKHHSHCRASEGAMCCCGGGH